MYEVGLPVFYHHVRRVLGRENTFLEPKYRFLYAYAKKEQNGGCTAKESKRDGFFFFFAI